ncbi:ubiquitin-conjugating enzyme/RWD-like protein, partial [Vararia minispora EC-137]
VSQELRDINSKPIDGVNVVTMEDNLFLWKCSSDSPYKGGTFHFRLEVPDSYPFKAPAVTFTTKIYHPGINEEGAICVPILRDQARLIQISLLLCSLRSQQWKPAISLSTVLTVIQEKINNPSPEDPFMPEIAAQLKDDKAAFLSNARDWTKKYVTGPFSRDFLTFRFAGTPPDWIQANWASSED